MKKWKNILMTSLFSSFLIGGVASADTYHFKDADHLPWATPSIEKLYQKGVIKGTDEYEFKPYDKVTRAELVTMVAKVMKEKPKQYDDFPFQDVHSNDWYYASIQKLYQMGVIEGTTPGLFEPNSQVTRQETAVLLSRAFDYSDNGNPLLFKDQTLISPWAISSVQAMAKKGYFQGNGGFFRPKEAITRAETAVVIHKIVYGFPMAYIPPKQDEKLASRSQDLIEKRWQRIVQPLLGVPYVWGGESLQGMDCSGFTSYVYHQIGKDIPRTSRDQYQVGSSVSLNEMKVGDLIFFDTGSGYISHVGMYIGNHKMAHATSGQGEVKIQDLTWYLNHYRVVGIKRIL